MRHHLWISLAVVVILITGCQPSAGELTDEPLTSEPTEAAVEPSAAPSSTPTLAPLTEEPTTTPTETSGPIPALNPEDYYVPLEGCKFLPPEVGENLIGTLMQPAWTEQVYSDTDTRLIVGCYYLGEDNQLILRVWVADNSESAQQDYDDQLTDAADEAVPVERLGDAAFWWPAALRLEVLHLNSRLWISLAKPLDDTANSAVMLAAQAIPLIDPSQPVIPAPEVVVPADAPTPEILADLSQQPEFFEACDLLTEDEFASVLGSPVGEPQSGSSIGEMVGYFYDCSVMDETQSNIVTYSIHVAGGPSAAIDRFRQDAHPDSPDAVELPIPDVGNRAYFWQLNEFQYQANVLRGNVVINFLFFVQASPENEQAIRELIALVVNRLFEQYGEK